MGEYDPNPSTGEPTPPKTAKEAAQIAGAAVNFRGTYAKYAGSRNPEAGSAAEAELIAGERVGYRGNYGNLPIRIARNIESERRETQVRKDPARWILGDPAGSHQEGVSEVVPVSSQMGGERPGDIRVFDVTGAVVAEFSPSKRSGYYPIETLGDLETQRKLDASPEGADRYARMGEILEVQRQRAYDTPTTLDDYFFLNELAKWNRTGIETSSEYHAFGTRLGTPIPANPFENWGDVALAFEKAGNKKDDFARNYAFNPNVGDLIKELPGGTGLQELGWNMALATDRGQSMPGRVSFSAAVSRVSASRGYYGPYGLLLGGKNDVITQTPAAASEWAIDATARTAMEAKFLEKDIFPQNYPIPGSPTERLAFDEYGRVLRPGGTFEPVYSAAGVPFNKKMGRGEYIYVGEYQYDTGETVSRFYEKNVGSFVDFDEFGMAGVHFTGIRSGGGPGSYYETNLPPATKSLEEIFPGVFFTGELGTMQTAIKGYRERIVNLSKAFGGIGEGIVPRVSALENMNKTPASFEMLTSEIAQQPGVPLQNFNDYFNERKGGFESQLEAYKSLGKQFEAGGSRDVGMFNVLTRSRKELEIEEKNLKLLAVANQGIEVSRNAVAQYDALIESTRVESSRSASPYLYTPKNEWEKFATAVNTDIFQNIPLLSDVNKAGRMFTLGGEESAQMNIATKKYNEFAAAGLIIPGETGSPDAFKGTDIQFREMSEPLEKASIIANERLRIESTSGFMSDPWGKTDTFLKQYSTRIPENLIESGYRTIKKNQRNPLNPIYIVPGIGGMEKEIDIFNDGLNRLMGKPEGTRTLPSSLDITIELAYGQIEGVRERPLETAFWFGVGLALPGVGSLAKKTIGGSRAFRYLQDLRYVPSETGLLSRVGVTEPIHPLRWAFGGINSRNPRLFTDAEVEQVMTVSGVSRATAEEMVLSTNMRWAAGNRVINAPLTLIEAGIGITYAQSVIERTTTKPTSSTYETHSVNYEIPTVNKNDVPTYKHLEFSNEQQGGTPAVNPRLIWEDSGLKIDIRPEKLPTALEMARNIGKISGVEIFPAVAGTIAGMWAWPKVTGLLKTRGMSRVNLAPEEAGVPRGSLGYVEGGTGWPTEYPIAQGVNRRGGEDLLQSFAEGTFIPYPEAMIGPNRVRGRVEYAPTHSFLPTDVPGGQYAWTTWEADLLPGVGGTFGLQRGSSEVYGMATGSGIYGYFGKIPSGQNRLQLFGLGFPTIKEPLVIRTNIGGFAPVPAEVRARGYDAMNAWARSRGQSGVSYLQLQKAEYEGWIPYITEGNLQTTLEVTARKHYVVIDGVRVPLAEAKMGTPVQLMPGEPLYVPPEALESIFGEKLRTGVTTTPEALLARLPGAERSAQESVMKISYEMERFPPLSSSGIRLGDIRTIGPQYATDVERVLQKYTHVVYGSATRTAYMDAGTIMSSYGKMPGDLDVRADDIFGLSKDLRNIWGKDARITIERSHANPNEIFGIKVSRKLSGAWEDVADIHPMKSTMQENPFGWTPSRTETIKGITFETMDQQVLRTAYGSLSGREVRGEWKWGPKLHRDKDILGFYNDIRFTLEQQPVKSSSNILSMRDEMRNLRLQSRVDTVLAGKTFKYGTGSNEFFAGLDFSRWKGEGTDVKLTAAELTLLKNQVVYKYNFEQAITETSKGVTLEWVVGNRRSVPHHNREYIDLYATNPRSWSMHEKTIVHTHTHPVSDYEIAIKGDWAVRYQSQPSARDIINVYEYAHLQSQIINREGMVVYEISPNIKLLSAQQRLDTVEGLLGFVHSRDLRKVFSDVRVSSMWDEILPGGAAQLDALDISSYRKFTQLPRDIRSGMYKGWAIRDRSQLAWLASKNDMGVAFIRGIDMETGVGKLHGFEKPELRLAGEYEKTLTSMGWYDRIPEQAMKTHYGRDMFAPGKGLQVRLAENFDNRMFSGLDLSEYTSKGKTALINLTSLGLTQAGALSVSGGKRINYDVSIHAYKNQLSTRMVSTGMSSGISSGKSISYGLIPYSRVSLSDISISGKSSASGSYGGGSYDIDLYEGGIDLYGKGSYGIDLYGIDSYGIDLYGGKSYGMKSYGKNSYSYKTYSPTKTPPPMIPVLIPNPKRQKRRKGRKSPLEWYIWNPVPTMETTFGYQLDIREVMPKTPDFKFKMPNVNMKNYRW